MGDRYANIPERLRSLERWVCALPDEKSPYCAFEARRASTSDPFTWSTFEEAVARVEEGIYSDIGFVFHEGDGIVGIDIDKGYDGEGVMTEDACSLIARCRSYTERSRSGRGFHILLGGTIPASKGMNNGDGYEIYSTGRYFLITGDILLYDGFEENQAAIDWILAKHFSEIDGERSQNVSDSRRAAFGYRPAWKGMSGKKMTLRPSYEPIQSGSRHTSLVSHAGRLWKAGYSLEDLTAELLRINEVACQPPLLEQEIRRIADSIGRYRR